MIIEFIDAQRRCGHRISTICAVLASLGIAFTERAYRRARSRGPSVRAVGDAVLIDALRWTRQPDPITGKLPRERFYGQRKMTHWLRRRGYDVSFCRVARLMRTEGLHGLRRGPLKRTTVRDKDSHPASDLVQRHFTAAVPDQLWIADITYVSTWSGWAYVAFVVDVFSQRILGWSLASTMHTRLVQDALSMAIWQREREHRPVAGLVHHSDKGSQYTSIAFGETLAISGILPSTGSVGDSYDNALMESINGLYKNECVKPAGPIKTLAQAEYETAEWVDWYNRDRLHSTTNYQTPIEYEHAHYDRQLAVLQPEPAHT